MGGLSLLQGIFLTQESNQGLLHCRWILYQLSYRKVLVGHYNVKNTLSQKKIVFFQTATYLCLFVLNVGIIKDSDSYLRISHVSVVSAVMSSFIYLYNFVKSSTKFVNFANLYKKPTVSFTNLLFSYSLFYSFLL